MKKLFLLPILFVFLFQTLHADQVYECKSLGFKFVIDCECNHLYMEPSYNHPYRMNPVPMITYITKDSPLAKNGIIVSSKIYMIGKDSTFGKTGEEILKMLDRSKGNTVELSIDRGLISINRQLYVFTFSATDFVFPQAEFSAVANGPKLLATVVMPVGETKAKKLMFDNGDVYTGMVNKNGYPDLKSTDSHYDSHEIKMTDERQTESKYLESIAAKEKEKQDAANALKAMQEKDLLSTGQLINEFDASKYANNLIFGIGAEFQPYYEGTTRYWQVSKVFPGTSAWFRGIDSGDVFVYIKTGPKSDLEIPTKKLSKPELIHYLTGNGGDSVTVIISKVHYAFFQDKRICFTSLLNRPADFAGACLTGNCADGNGTWMNKNGDIFIGNFSSGLLNGIGTEISKTGDFIYNGSFVDGKKEGLGNTQLGAGIQDRDKLITKTLSVKYVNDLPEGKGKINSFNLIQYEVVYTKGKMTSAKIVYDNDDYCICDVNTLAVQKCYNALDKEIAKNAAGTVAIANAECTYDPNTDPNYGNTVAEQANIVTVLTNTGNAFKKVLANGEVFQTEGTFVFLQSKEKQSKNLSFKVPPHQELSITIILSKTDADRVCYEFSKITFPGYSKTGYPGIKYGHPVGDLYVVTIFAFNNTDMEGVFDLLVSGYVSSRFSTRTIYYMTTLSPKY